MILNKFKKRNNINIKQYYKKRNNINIKQYYKKRNNIHIKQYYKKRNINKKIKYLIIIYMVKIICVGQPKTGTKSFAYIFNMLNYKVCSNPICCYPNDEYILLDNNIKYYACDDITINNIINKNITLFDVFHDIPYSFNYEYIYKLYPDSKFILLLRDEESWFKSLFNYQSISGATNENILYKLYGYKNITYDNYNDIISKYNKYNEDIINFFSDKKDSLLIINLINCWDKSNEIKKLEIFLNIKINFDCPHINKQIYK